MERRCLYCYEPLASEQVDFHQKCSRKMFGTDTPPLVPYHEEGSPDQAGFMICQGRRPWTMVHSTSSLETKQEGMRVTKGSKRVLMDQGALPSV